MKKKKTEPKSSFPFGFQVPGLPLSAYALPESSTRSVHTGAPCTRCGSTSTTSTIEDVLGRRFHIEKCEACGHEDEWFLGYGDDEDQ